MILWKWKFYGRCCKKKCKEFRSCLISQLDNMYENDPEAYWKLLKNLKEDSSPNEPSQSISANERLKHFESLYKIKDKFSHQEEEFQNQLKDLTNVHTFSELDSRITEKGRLVGETFFYFRRRENEFQNMIKIYISKPTEFL